MGQKQEPETMELKQTMQGKREIVKATVQQLSTLQEKKQSNQYKLDRFLQYFTATCEPQIRLSDWKNSFSKTHLLSIENFAVLENRKVFFKEWKKMQRVSSKDGEADENEWFQAFVKTLGAFAAKTKETYIRRCEAPQENVIFKKTVVDHTKVSLPEQQDQAERLVTSVKILSTSKKHLRESDGTTTLFT